MRQKSEAHKGLSLMAQRDGVPPLIVMDGSKEQTLGLFRKKLRQMGSRVKQSEPDTPQSIFAEGVIREVKRGSRRKMARAKGLAKLWDQCIELEGYICLNMARDN